MRSDILDVGRGMLVNRDGENRNPVFEVGEVALHVRISRCTVTSVRAIATTVALVRACSSRTAARSALISSNPACICLKSSSLVTSPMPPL